MEKYPAHTTFSILTIVRFPYYCFTIVSILTTFVSGLRHVLLEAGSSGLEEAVEALTGALAFGMVSETGPRGRGGGGWLRGR